RSLAPPGEDLLHRVHEHDGAFRIGRDDGVADAAKRRPQALLGLARVGFRTPPATTLRFDRREGDRSEPERRECRGEHEPSRSPAALAAFREALAKQPSLLVLERIENLARV